MKKRLDQLKQTSKSQGQEAVLITSTANVYYLSDFYCNPKERFLGLLLYTDEREPAIICPKMETSLAIDAGWTHDIIGYEDTENPLEKIPFVSSLAIEEDHLIVARYNELKRLQPSLSLSSIDGALLALRAAKDDEEIVRLQEAAEFADIAVELGVSVLREGVSELEVIAHIESELKAKGITKMSFDPVVLFGPNAANPHGKPGTSTLKRGDAVLMDLGVMWKGYASDITRTVFFGEPTSAHRHVYETVLEANEAGISACVAGDQIKADIAARNVIERAGFGEYFTHRLGHGLGIEVHEAPSMHGNNEERLENGMALTVEPGIYQSGDIGVRIEDDIIVTVNGPLVLTRYPKTLQII
ncbi:LOW QUALITY PROTEIN: aminopeptidase YpdF [Geomicrobium sp. JCM 19037]|nr:LOW QUALITY PROTEIN: aminopeptidase YpdF [Geomicrobium sp. JCM 19037]